MLREIWSASLSSPACSICFARESGSVLLWDAAGWLTALNRRGQIQAQTRFADGLVNATISEEGSSIVAITFRGDIHWLNRDFRSLWQQRLDVKACGAALDPLGGTLALADEESRIHLLKRNGVHISKASTPRPLRYLSFVPQTGQLIGAADFGLIMAHDVQNNQLVWRDAPIVNIAGLAVSGTGDLIALASISDGIRVYHKDGKPRTSGFKVSRARWVGIGYDAKTIMTLNLDGQLTTLGPEGNVLSVDEPFANIISVAMDGFGERLVLATPDRVVMLQHR